MAKVLVATVMRLKAMVIGILVRMPGAGLVPQNISLPRLAAAKDPPRLAAAKDPPPLADTFLHLSRSCSHITSSMKLHPSEQIP